jgi:hypothetical protein
MPKKGYNVVTISENLYQKAKETMNEVNKKAGYRKFRSVSHFVEESLILFCQKEETESSK